MSVAEGCGGKHGGRGRRLAVMVKLGWEPSINAGHIGVATNACVVTLTRHV